jgi:hypothetical protein
MMAILLGGSLLLSIFADTSNTSVFSVVGGILFWAVLSIVFGVSKGEDRVREWRERHQ